MKTYESINPTKIDAQKRNRKGQNLINAQCSKPPNHKDEQKRKKRTNNILIKQKKINKMTGVCPYSSIITLDVEELNFLIERHRLSGFFKKVK